MRRLRISLQQIQPNFSEKPGERFLGHWQILWVPLSPVWADMVPFSLLVLRGGRLWETKALTKGMRQLDMEFRRGRIESHQM